MRITRLCEIDDCDHPYLAKGMCRMHYERVRRNNTTDDLAKRNRTIEQSVASHTEWVGECLVWTGDISDQGYGIITRRGRPLRAHREVFRLAFPELKPEQYVDHKCHNRACVNMKHLRVASPKQNNENRRGANKNSATGVRGVSALPRGGGYYVQVTHNRHNYRKSGFKTLEAAKQAAIELRNQLFTHNTEGVA